MITIEGWDYAPYQCNSKMQALFYFIPNWEMISFLRINGNLHVPVFVKGTGLYDGHYFARLDKQPGTDYHIVFLPLEFKGFPEKKGTMDLVPDFRCHKPELLTCIKNHCCVR